jgi:branched-chain amino acid transport system permease protein
MANLSQLLVSAIATGAIYALVALGFTLLWQTSQTVNFAQGEFVMLPAFFVLAGMKFLGLSLWEATLLGFALSLLVLGVLFKRAVIDPMLPHGLMPVVITTIAFGILLKECVKGFYSAEGQTFPALVPVSTVSIGGAMVSVLDLFNLAVAVVAVILLQLFLTRTMTGRKMQAVAQNRAVAEILGMPVQKLILLTFLINAALVCLASVLISPNYLAKFSNGEELGLIAFTAAIVGGFNQVKGALAGGLIVGLANSLTATYISTQYRIAVPLFFLVAIILIRPQGLLGRLEERTV